MLTVYKQARSLATFLYLPLHFSFFQALFCAPGWRRELCKVCRQFSIKNIKSILNVRKRFKASFSWTKESPMETVKGQIKLIQLEVAALNESEGEEH